MAVLRISDSSSSQLGLERLARLARRSGRPLTVSELFLRGPGGAKARSLMTPDTMDASPWHAILMPLANIVAQLLWPRCAVPDFQEFMLAACQHMHIQVKSFIFKIRLRFCERLITFVGIREAAWHLVRLQLPLQAVPARFSPAAHGRAREGLRLDGGCCRRHPWR